MRRAALLVVAAAGVSGCGAADRARDDDGAVYEIVAQPRVVLGVASGDPAHEFHRVVSPFVLPDDRIAVPLAGSNEIRVFSPDGAFMTSLGRAGRGPGEFVALGAAWAVGDTIEAYDFRLARFTRFMPDGSVQIVSAAGALSMSFSAVPGSLVSGFWIVAGVAGTAVGGRDDILIGRVPHDGSRVDTLARVPGIARVGTPGGSSGPAPLSPRAKIIVAGDAVYYAETMSPNITVLAANGDARHIRWAPEHTPTVRGSIEAVRDAASRTVQAETMASLERQLDALPLDETLSVFWDFLVDDAGFLWVQSYDPVHHAVPLGGLGRGSYLLGTAPGGEWSVYSPNGGRVSRVGVPDGLQLVHVVRDLVLAIRADSLGVEYVQIHDLRRH